MGEFKESLKHYEKDTDLLKEFRINIMNEHTCLKKYIENQYKDIDNYSREEFENEELREFDEKYYEVSPRTVADIFSEINLDISKIKIHDRYSHEVECNYSYCRYNDLWNILCETLDFDFFVIMGYISQTYVYNGTLEELQKIVKRVLRYKGIKIQSIKPTVFIAMSFDKDLANVRNSLSKTVQNVGLVPVLIDEKEHNNQIVPEIFSEIDKAQFVIADLTRHKTGVYYEAGYAKGREKEVIFTCHKSDFKKRHFDVAQSNIIVWEKPEDLSERLVKRIEAMTLMSDDHDRLKSSVSVPIP